MMDKPHNGIPVASTGSGKLTLPTVTYQDR